MALSAAEKQRLYRARRDADPERRARHIQKEKKRWEARKLTGDPHAKSIGDMTERQKRHVRRYWKIERARNRKEMKERKKHLDNMATPPSSPPMDNVNVNQSWSDRRRMKARKERHRRMDNLTKLYKKQIRETEKYKKRWQRLLHHTRANNEAASPRSRTMYLLRHATTSTIRKTLTFHHAVLVQIKTKYKATKERRLKAAYCHLLSGTILNKYKLRRYAEHVLGMSSFRPWHTKCTSSHVMQTKSYQSLRKRITQPVRDFFVRDDNSRIVAGIKDTITLKKVKKQKRFLTDTLSNLHAKYLSENPKSLLSYSLFCKMRPFWFVQPKEKDKLICLCKLHENTQLAVGRLKAVGVLDDDNLERIIKTVSCNISSKSCMYGECDKCRELDLQTNETDMNADVTWIQWKTVKEIRNIQGNDKQITVTAKQEISGNKGDLLWETIDLLQRYRKHVFNIKHQYNCYKELRTKMTPSECMIHVDFSENYVAKCSQEIQSMHFGASKNQISLHTGVYFVGPEGVPKTFCSVSDSNNHGPAAIWTHLDPILDCIQKENPQVNTMHFFSDGPTTQYKQELNFYLFSNNIEERGLKFSTWNFFESGHGKGIPDGVGATIKRTADAAVRRGRDCTNARDMVDIVESTGPKTRIFLIPEKAIDGAITSLANATVTPVKGTMKLHQIATTSTNTFSYRDISCMCTQGTVCKCFNPKIHNITRAQNPCVANDTPVKTSTPDFVVDSPALSQSWERRRYFSHALAVLGMCRTYKALRNTSIKLMETIDEKYSSIVPIGNQGITPDMTIDEATRANMPEDIGSVNGHQLLPITVSADGNCLPHTASTLAFGHQNADDEMRVRILTEMVVHDEVYLDSDHLRKGAEMTDREARQLLNNYCMYSGQFAISGKITKSGILQTFQSEALEIRHNFTFMGFGSCLPYQVCLAPHYFQFTPIRVYRAFGKISTVELSHVFKIHAMSLHWCGRPRVSGIWQGTTSHPIISSHCYLKPSPLVIRQTSC